MQSFKNIALMGRIMATSQTHSSPALFLMKIVLLSALLLTVTLYRQALYDQFFKDAHDDVNFSTVATGLPSVHDEAAIAEMAAVKEEDERAVQSRLNELNFAKTLRQSFQADDTQQEKNHNHQPYEPNPKRFWKDGALKTPGEPTAYKNAQSVESRRTSLLPMLMEANGRTEMGHHVDGDEKDKPSSSSFSSPMMSLMKAKREMDDSEGWENITCDVCKFIVSNLQEMVEEMKTRDEIIAAVVDFCRTFHIESDRVCAYVVRQYASMAIAVIQNTIFSPDDICGVVLGDSCGTPYNPFVAWNITLSNKPKPPVKPHLKPKPGSPTLRVLHLTDIHIDIEYVEGADAQCGEPLCCRAYDINPAPNKSRRAGEWGDYRHCDMPWTTLDELFQHLGNIKDKFDYVIFTGDIPAHDVWNQTIPQQLANMERVTKLFRKYLPDKPVYTSSGNHEGVPCNSFPPSTVPGQSMEWFYSAYEQAWGYWLPESTFPTIMRGGFYTFSPYPGFRIVSFNSNFGASLNWWLFINATDPEGQMQWLADVLQEAEDKGEKVHILSHFPPGETLSDFARNYYTLINRYESTITGQFHGHTHKDEIEVFYDLSNISRPVGVSYIGGSVTTYHDTNSAYRIYTIDGNYNGSSYEVLDYSHYYLDIPVANTVGKPVWLKEYTASETYKMPSLFPEDWNNLIYRMKDDDDLFQKYYKFYYKSAKHHSCTDSVCKKGYLCKMKQALSGLPGLCDDL